MWCLLGIGHYLPGSPAYLDVDTLISEAMLSTFKCHFLLKKFSDDSLLDSNIVADLHQSTLAVKLKVS